MEASATVDLPTLNILVGVLIPLLVGLVTKKVSSSGLKSVINFGLSALTGALGAVIANGGNIPDLKAFVYGIAMTWGSSILSYYGLTKPTGIADKVTEKTRNFGIGTPPAPSMETDEKGATEEGERTAALMSIPTANESAGYGTFTVWEGEVNLAKLNKNVGERGTVTFATTGTATPGTISDPPSVVVEDDQ